MEDAHLAVSMLYMHSRRSWGTCFAAVYCALLPATAIAGQVTLKSVDTIQTEKNRGYLLSEVRNSGATSICVTLLNYVAYFPEDDHLPAPFKTLKTEILSFHFDDGDAAAKSNAIFLPGGVSVKVKTNYELFENMRASASKGGIAGWFPSEDEISDVERRMNRGVYQMSASLTYVECESLPYTKNLPHDRESLIDGRPLYSLPEVTLSFKVAPVKVPWVGQ